MFVDEVVLVDERVRRQTRTSAIEENGLNISRIKIEFVEFRFYK